MINIIIKSSFNILKLNFYGPNPTMTVLINFISDFNVHNY